MRGLSVDYVVLDEAEALMPVYGRAPNQVEVEATPAKADGTREVWWRWVDNATTYHTWTTASTAYRWPVQEATWQRWTTSATTNTITIAMPQQATWMAWNETPTATVPPLTTVTVALDDAARVARGMADGLRPMAEAGARVTEQMRVEMQRQRDAIQAAREEQSRRRLAERQRLEGAHERGMDLLLSLLTTEEREVYDATRHIEVTAPSGRRYLIETHSNSVHGNIVELDEHGCRLGRVCVAPGMYDHGSGLALPLADGWVGQYLAAKFNEEAMRATGNWSHLGRCAVRQPVPGRLLAA